MKINFHSYANKTNFHMKSFAFSLALIMRFKATLEMAYCFSLKTIVRHVSLGVFSSRHVEFAQLLVGESCSFCNVVCIFDVRHFMARIRNTLREGLEGLLATSEVFHLHFGHI